MAFHLRGTKWSAAFVLIAFWIGMLSATPALCADTEGIYKLETAFIFQFTNYIEWPTKTESNHSDKNPFLIDVVGNSPIIQELESLAKSKTVKGRNIIIYNTSELSKLRRCNIIVMASSDEELFSQIVKETEKSGTLIVSYANGFAKRGAAINFFIEDGRLRFEINRATLEQQRLEVSSQLLKLAKLVD